MKIHYFYEILKNNIIGISEKLDMDYECIDISKWEQDSFIDKDILYVVDINDLPDLTKIHASPHLIISNPDKVDLPDPEMNYLNCTLPFEKLWKIARHSFHLLQHYDHILMHALLYEYSLSEILNKASEYWEASFYFFNEGGQLLISAEHSNQNNSIDPDILSGSNLLNLFNQSQKLDYDKDMAILNEPFNKNIITLKKVESSKTTHWLIMVGSRENRIPLMYAFRLTANFASRCIDQGNIRKIEASSLSEVMGAILNDEIKDPDVIFKKLLPNANPNERYYFRLLLIGGETLPLNTQELSIMQKELSRNCPEINFVIYSGEIIGIMIYPFSEEAKYDNMLTPLWTEGKSIWLKDYIKSKQCKCLIDEANSKFSSLKANWELCHGIFRICRKMPTYLNKTCIRGDLAKSYWLIESGYKYFFENVAQISPILLCSPAYVILCKHDIQHNTNLTEILYSYLRNSGNIEKTAKDCYVHRNTVKNKLQLIQRLTNIDLDEPENFTNLIISKYLMDYFIHYMGGDIISDTKKMK